MAYFALPLRRRSKTERTRSMLSLYAGWPKVAVERSSSTPPRRTTTS
jgi:hypothetical protein